jgi:hypothetical protein
MIQWTTEAVLALAPDSSSAKSGRDLASARKWLSFARNEDTTALWGECQGSGKLPYQTQLAFAEGTPTFKCSCPSRKFPCKHGLGLLLLYASDANSFKHVELPSWVSEWLESRTKRAQAKAEKVEKPKEVDPAAQAKRATLRDKKVAAGVEDLSLWLRDLVRGGLAQLPSKGYSFWETAAARLVDAQAPGLARLVRELPEYLSGEAWSEGLLERLGRIHLLLEAYKNLANLSEVQQADVRSSIGFTQSQEDVLSLAGVQDTWWVLGQVIMQEDKLKVRRSWLQGQESKRDALILEFAHGQQAFTAPLALLQCWKGEVVYYSSSYPLRALLKGGELRQEKIEQLEAETFEGMMDKYSSALSCNPWLEQIPLHLTATLEPFTNELRTEDNQRLRLHPLALTQARHTLLAYCGGHFLHFFGEWDGACFLPLSLYDKAEGGCHALHYRENE